MYDGTIEITPEVSMLWQILRKRKLATEEQLQEVLEEMSDSGEEVQLDCYKADSKNYSGKQFLTCTVI